jgi:acyl dehydratase
MVDIVAAYSGRRQVYNPLRLGVMERERHPANVYVSPQTGVPMHPAAGHLDPEIAAEIGMPGVYDLGWMRANWMVSSVVNWMGDWGFIRTLNYRVPRPNLLGDATWCHARVSRKLTHGPEHLVEIEGWGENQNGERNFEATLLARLPSRDLGDQYLFDHPEPLADLVTGSDSAPDAGNG